MGGGEYRTGLSDDSTGGNVSAPEYHVLLGLYGGIELYRLAEEKHLFLMEAFWIWLLPLYDRLREILTAGTIGELKQITCQYGFVALRRPEGPQV